MRPDRSLSRRERAGVRVPTCQPFFATSFFSDAFGFNSSKDFPGVRSLPVNPGKLVA